MVGGGPAGLATSQQLRQQRIPHRVLERGDAVGYTWANLYDSLTLHTGKHMSSLPGMPFPPSAPLFVPRRAFLDYLRCYAERFDLPVDTGPSRRPSWSWPRVSSPTQRHRISRGRSGSPDESRTVSHTGGPMDTPAAGCWW